jgi:DNA-binding response OmpR family regulator
MARILIIDDDPDTRDFLEHTLNLAHHQTFTAAEGREGLKRFLCDPVDLVITDIFMPELDGLEMIAGLRTRCSSAACTSINASPASRPCKLSPD